MPTAIENLEGRLASILGAGRVQSQPHNLSEYAIDEVIPRAVVKPGNAAEAAEIVRFAAAEGLAVIAVGTRSKLGMGMPPARYDIAMDMTAMREIAHYDPGDLTLSVDAGCTLGTIDAALRPQRQFLPLTMGYGHGATIAGTVASGVDSHLRQSYGTARDFLVGAEFIDGLGAQCKSGGRVVKNVTGYDLHKLLIGSLGTLAIITRLNFRTFPSLNAAEAQGIFVASFSDAKGAIDFRQRIAASPFTPQAVEIWSPEVSKILSDVDSRSWEPPSEPLSAWIAPGDWHVVVLFAGTREIRDRYSVALGQLADAAGALRSPTVEVGEAGDVARTVGVLVVDTMRRVHGASQAATIFKIAQVPAKLPELFAGLAKAAEQAQIPHALFARGLGITYFALLPEVPPNYLATAQVAAGLGPAEMEQLVAGAYGETIGRLEGVCKSIFSLCAGQSATVALQFAPRALKRRINLAFGEAADAAAMRKLKLAFDPHNIFAPGRMFS